MIRHSRSLRALLSSTVGLVLAWGASACDDGSEPPRDALEAESTTELEADTAELPTELEPDGDELDEADALEADVQVDELDEVDTADAADVLPLPADPVAFVAAPELAFARSSHTATLLDDGNVLVVGGERVLTREALDTVELFMTTLDTWYPVQALPEARTNHVAVRLGDGRVLVAGGGLSAPIGVPRGEGVLASAVLYDPGTRGWSSTGSMLEARSHFTATLLPSGRVLVVGGGGSTHTHGSTCSGVPDCGPLADTLGSAEIFDPTTGEFIATAPLTEPRFLHTATRLPDGRVLVAAGANDYQLSFASTEIYDERTETWAPGPDLASADRLFHSAALLPSGQVLVGGGKKSNVAFLASVVRVDAVAMSSEATGSLSIARTGGAFVSLASGRVLSVGGFRCPNPCTTIDAAEIYDEGTGAWTAIDALASSRAMHTATLLDDGRVLVVGGYGPADDLRSCEISRSE